MHSYMRAKYACANIFKLEGPEGFSLMHHHDSSSKKSAGLKGGPESLENEINIILGSKCKDLFSDHFSDLVQNIF